MATSTHGARCCVACLLVLVLVATAVISGCQAQPAGGTEKSSGSGSGSGSGSATAEFSLELLDKLLADSVKFWLQHGIDKESGGWFSNLDKNGTPVAPFNKNSKVQADNLYWLSLLAADSPPPVAAAAAAAGANLTAVADATYAFLMRMRRPDGLFAWESNRQGSEATMPGPHLFSQWQAITALAQYGRALGKPAAVDAALETFRAVDKRFYEARMGVFDASKGEYLAVKVLPGPGNNSALAFNTFMQSIPAMGELYRSVKDPLLQARLLEAVRQLCDDMPFPINTPIQAGAAASRQNAPVAAESAASSRDGGAGSTPLRFAMNYDTRRKPWKPAVVGDTSTAMGLNDSAVDYAHTMAHLWRALDVIEVLSAAGALPAARRSSCRQRLASVGAWYAAQAFDTQHGGMLYAGYVGQPPSKTIKVGWAQTESLNSLWHLWQVTGDASYLSMLQRTLNFIYNSQLRDPQDGELFYQVDQAGQLMPGDVKAGLPKAQVWKDAFHTIRPYARLRAAAKGALGYAP